MQIFWAREVLGIPNSMLQAPAWLVLAVGMATHEAYYAVQHGKVLACHLHHKCAASLQPTGSPSSVAPTGPAVRR